LLLLGETRVRSGSRQLAWEAFRQAADLAARAGDAASLARAAIGASRRYIQQPGVVDRELIELLNRALEATAGERSLVRVQLLARACGAIYYAPERERMGELSDEAAQIADELDDPEARANACAARRRARWDAAHLRERLETSTEMLTLARRTSNLELELQAHAWLVVDLLEDGDRDAVDAQIAAFTAGAQRLRQPLYLWNATVWRAMRALLAGHLTEADLLATEALAAGAPAEAVTAPQYYAIQILAIRREQLRMRELEDAARQLVQSNPARPAWRAALATLLLESGRAAEARALFEELAVDQFREIPRDLDWMIAMTLMSDVCVALGDGGRAAVLYEQLLPYADVNVVIGLATVCLGSAARFLGKLAATMGRMEDAAEHFERALVGNARLKTPVYLAHAQLDYAHALGSGSRSAGLVAAAARTAAELELPAVAMRARELGERLR
jgi:tetratricopeptide (TPR) repeat protein